MPELALLKEKIFDRTSALLLLMLALPLLFLPKINLVAFGRETAGLRIDDIVLLVFACFCFFAHFAVRPQFSSIEKTVAGILALSVVSFIFNKLFLYGSLLEVPSSIFYAVRLLEYFCFFYVGALSVHFFSMQSIVLAFFLWNFVLMILQKFQIIGIFSVEGYQPITSDRILGIASFGSEIGLLLNLLFCFLIYMKIPMQQIKDPFNRFLVRCVQNNLPYYLLLVFVALVVLSGARTAIVALLISFVGSLKHFVQWRRPSSYIMPAFTVAMAGLILVVVLYNYSGIILRSKGLISFNNISLIGTVWDNIVLEYDPIGRESVSQGMHDASWWMRIHKWCYALKLYYLHPECWLQGIGPGFAMAALDGGFLRILTELGLLGVYLFGRLFYLIASQGRQLKWMVIVFLLNMLFFDAYLAYKPMSLLFLVSGASYQPSEGSRTS